MCLDSLHEEKPHEMTTTEKAVSEFEKDSARQTNETDEMDPSTCLKPLLVAMRSPKLIEFLEFCSDIAGKSKTRRRDQMTSATSCSAVLTRDRMAILENVASV